MSFFSRLQEAVEAKLRKNNLNLLIKDTKYADSEISSATVTQSSDTAANLPDRIRIPPVRMDAFSTETGSRKVRKARRPPPSNRY